MCCLKGDTGILSGFDVAVQESENMLTKNLSLFIEVYRYKF